MDSLSILQRSSSKKYDYFKYDYFNITLIIHSANPVSNGSLLADVKIFLNISCLQEVAD